MKVLLLGPYAPHGQVGAIRIISLSRYLVSKGHRVTVLCLSEEILRITDPNGLSAQIPDGVEVVTYKITLQCKSLMKKNALNEKECLSALKHLLNTKQFDVVLVSGGPFYTFYSMREVRKKHIPYVVDYRDLHLSSPDKRKRASLIDKMKFLASYPARFYQEYSCIRPADRITVVAPEMRDNLGSYFHLSKDKFTVVYNGYDDAVLKDLKPQNTYRDCFTIGYFGKLMYYNKDYTKKLFYAIEELYSAGIKVKLLHIGPENPAIQDFFSQEGRNQKKWYKCTGLMNYRKGMEILAGCDACALEYAYPEGPGTKIFDYICLNKPVIGITKPGISLERLLSNFEHAYICHSKDDVKKAISDLVENNINTLMDGSQAHEVIESYSRSCQNAVFETVLKELVDEA